MKVTTTKIITICLIILLIVESLYFLLQFREWRDYSSRTYALLEARACYHLYNGLIKLNGSAREDGIIELKLARLYIQLLAENSIAKEKGMSIYLNYIASNISLLIDYAEKHNLSGKIKYRRNLFYPLRATIFRFEHEVSKYDLSPENLMPRYISWELVSNEFKWYVKEIIGEID